MKMRILPILLLVVAMIQIGCGKNDDQKTVTAAAAVLPCPDYLRSRGMAEHRINSYCSGNPTAECLTYVSNLGYDVERTASYCYGGISASCLDSKVKVGYSLDQSWYLCRQGY